MTRRIMYTLFYIFLCMFGATTEVIPNVGLSSVGAYLGGLIMGASSGGIIGVIAMLVIGYWQDFPLSPAGHMMVALSVGTAAYYFTEMYRRYAGTGWHRYLICILSGYVCHVGMGIFLLWSFIGNDVLVLFVPWTISSLLSMIIALAVDYGWPDQLRNLLGAEVRVVSTGRNRAKKKRKELREQQEKNEEEFAEEQ